MQTTKLLLLTALLAGILPSAFAGPIHDAARAGDVATLKQLLAAGANIEEVSDVYSNKSTPLILASSSDEQAAAVEFLLKKKANTEARDANDQTPLMWAVIMGRPKTVQLLLEHGAKINAKKYGQTSALSMSLVSHNLQADEIITILLTHGAEISKSDLSTTAHSGRTAALRLLLNRTGNVDEDLGNGHTLLMMACAGGQVETVRYLLELGADVTLKTKNDTDVLAFCKNENVRHVIEEAKQRQASAGIAYWLTRTNYDSPALTEALITAETAQLPDWLSTATVQQKVALLTDVKKQLARASVRIDELNAEASAAIAGKQDPVPFRKRAGQIKAYINVLNEIKAILEQS